MSGVSFPSRSIRHSGAVSLGDDVRRLIREAVDVSLENEKEIGIFACGRIKGEDIFLDRGIIKTSNYYDPATFRFWPHNFDSIERAVCDRDEALLALLHTHPDGNVTPSNQDRRTSEDIGILGCVVSKEDLACYFGERDIPAVL